MAAGADGCRFSADGTPWTRRFDTADLFMGAMLVYGLRPVVSRACAEFIGTGPVDGIRGETTRRFRVRRVRLT